MNEVHAYYDVYKREFYSPWESCAVRGFVIPRADLVRLRLATTYGRCRVNRFGIPKPNLTDIQYPLTDYSSAVFALKTDAQLEVGNATPGESELAYSVAGFDPSDTEWHHLAGNLGLVTLAPIVIGVNVLAATYNLEISLLKTNDRWTLSNSVNPLLDGTPLKATVTPGVYTAEEGNAPAGTPGSVGGEWSISGTSKHTDVTVTNATSLTKLAIGVTPPTGEPGDPGAIIQVPLGGGANTVRLSVNQAPGTGAAFNGNWTLLNL